MESLHILCAGTMAQPIYRGAGARLVVAANLAIVFMGSTLVSPLYVLYQRRFDFSVFIQVHHALGMFPA